MRNLHGCKAVEAVVQNNPEERPPVESEVIDARDIEPEGDGHVNADEVPRTDLAPPSYEANQAVGGQDAHPGGGTDAGNTRTEASA